MHTKLNRGTVSHLLGDSLSSKIFPGRDNTCCVKSCSLLCHIRSQHQFQKIDCSVFRNLGNSNTGGKGRFNLTCEANDNTRRDYAGQCSYSIVLVSLLR